MCVIYVHVCIYAISTHMVKVKINGKKWQAKNFKPLESTTSLVDFRGKFNSQILDTVIEN